MNSEARAEWRLLGIAANDGATNMAIDEAIALACSRGLVQNTVRLYQWRPPAVSIGYFLRLNDVVDPDACRNLGIDVVRRISGGGAVFHSENEVTYSVIVRGDDPVVPNDVIESYKKFSAATAYVPRKLGLDAYFEPGRPGVCPNIVVDGKKIGGSAQARKRGVILQHGTLLLDCDLEIMARVLRLPVRHVKEKVTTVAREVHSHLDHVGNVLSGDRKEVQTILREGFEKSLGISLKDGELTKPETEESHRLRAKYSSNRWTNMR